MQTLPETAAHGLAASLRRWADTIEAAPPGELAALAPSVTLPGDADFRPWLKDGLELLGISARQIAIEAGLSHNSVNRYLRDPGRSLNLRTAHTIVCKMQENAAAQGKVLRRIGGGNG